MGREFSSFIVRDFYEGVIARGGDWLLFFRNFE